MCFQGAEEEPSQWKYKEDKKLKKNIRERKKFTFEEYSDEKEEKGKRKVAQKT